MSEKKKVRASTSWKSEAEKLERLLLLALGETGGPVDDLPEELGIWWKEHLAAEKTERTRLKKKALSKLSVAERNALNL